MPTRRYRLTASTSSTSAAIDSFAVARPGTIRQISFHMHFNSITDGASVQMQVSKSAVADFSVGAGTLTPALAEFYQYGNFVTSGLDQVAGNFVVDCNDKVNVGDVLYLNVVIAGTVAILTDVLLVVEEGGS